MQGEDLHILLVEDNLDHAELIRRSFALHRVANHITHVVDGEAALEYLFQRGAYGDADKYARPHVVLLDLRLPKIDGLEVLKAIRACESLKTIPVVVLTTSQAGQDVTGAYGQHVNSYLVKPVDFAAFAKLMEDLGFYWLAWNYYPWS
jgi:CheY-like chemotaxis protein